MQIHIDWKEGGKTSDVRDERLGLLTDNASTVSHYVKEGKREKEMGEAH